MSTVGMADFILKALTSSARYLKKFTLCRRSFSLCISVTLDESAAASVLGSVKQSVVLKVFRYLYRVLELYLWIFFVVLRSCLSLFLLLLLCIVSQNFEAHNYKENYMKVSFSVFTLCMHLGIYVF